MNGLAMNEQHDPSHVTGVAWECRSAGTSAVDCRRLWGLLLTVDHLVSRLYIESLTSKQNDCLKSSTIEMASYC